MKKMKKIYKWVTKSPPTYKLEDSVYKILSISFEVFLKNSPLIFLQNILKNMAFQKENSIKNCQKMPLCKNVYFYKKMKFS